MLGLLDQLAVEKGVPKSNQLENDNIIKSENSTLNDVHKSKSSLSSVEKRRLTETFTLFNKLFFEYQKKQTVDIKEETLSTKIAADQQKSTDTKVEDNSKGGGLMSMIIGGLTLLAVSVGGIISSISGFFGDAGSKVMESIGKLGFMGALKMLAKTILKKFSMGVLKKLPFIGGIIGLYFAYEAFKEGNIFKGVAELISALLNFVPGIGPILSIGADLLIAWADSKGVFSEGGILSPENGWNTIKGWMASIGKTIMDNALYLPIIGGFKRFGMAYDAFKSGDVGEGLKQTALGLMTFVGGGGIIKGFEILSGWLNSPKESEGSFKQDSSWMDRLRDWIREKLKDLPEWLAAPLRWFGILEDKTSGVAKIVAKGAKDGSKGVVDYVVGVWDNIKGPMGSAVDTIGSYAKGAWKSTTDMAKSAWDKAKEAGSWFSDSISAMTQKTKDMINDWLPGIVDTISGISDSAMKVLKGIADKIGSWFKSFFSAEDEKKLQEYKEVQKTNNDSTNDKYIEIIQSSSTSQLKGLNLLYKESINQTKLLSDLVNIGSNSLRELRRMSGNSSGGGNVTVVSPQSQSEKQMITIPNNRDGYASSPYALG